MMKNLIIKNLQEKFAFIPSHLPDMQIQKVGPLTVINSHLQTDMFNIIVPHKDLIPTPAEIGDAIKPFRTNNLPFAFWMTADQYSSFQELLKNFSLQCIEEEVGMTIPLRALQPSLKINKDLEIKPLNSEEILNDWIHVFSQLLPDEANAIQSFYQSARTIILNHPHKMRCFVGYLNQEPVTTCALFLSDDIAGVFDMITLPKMQRQGIATTMMSHALHKAKNAGFEFACLSASKEGQPVYEQLGFETHSHFKIYS